MSELLKRIVRTVSKQVSWPLPPTLCYLASKQEVPRQNSAGCDNDAMVGCSNNWLKQCFDGTGQQSLHFLWESSYLQSLHIKLGYEKVF